MKALIAFISLIIYSLPLSENNVQYTLENSQSTLTVSGTSSLHPWEIELLEMNCTADVNIVDNQLEFLALKFEAEAEKLKSEHGRIMDNKTHKALKSDDYPKITFTLNSPQSLKITNGSFSGILNGELNMAGTKKSIELKIKGTNENSTVSLLGEKTLLMTNFNMSPPTALMGTIKTGDEVTIHYKIKLKSK